MRIIALINAWVVLMNCCCTIPSSVDASASSGSASEGIMWKYELPEGSSVYPVAAEDGTTYLVETVYSQSNDRLVAIDASGNEKWSYHLWTVGYIPVVGNDGAIYTIADIGDNTSTIYSIGTDGAFRWKFNLSKDLPGLRYDNYIDELVAGPDGGAIFLVGDQEYRGTEASSFFIGQLSSSGQLQWCTELNGRLAGLRASDGVTSAAWVTTPEKVYALSSDGTVCCMVDLLSMKLNAIDAWPIVGPDGTLYQVFVNSTKSYTYSDVIWNYDSFDPPRIMAICPNGTLKWSLELVNSSDHMQSLHYALVGLTARGTLIVQSSPCSKVNESTYPEWAGNGTKVVASIPGKIFEILHDGTSRSIVNITTDIYPGPSGTNPSAILTGDIVYLVWDNRMVAVGLDGAIIGQLYGLSECLSKIGDPAFGILYIIYGAGATECGTLMASKGLPVGLPVDDNTVPGGGQALTNVTIIMVVMLVCSSTAYLVLSRRRSGK